MLVGFLANDDPVRTSLAMTRLLATYTHTLIAVNFISNVITTQAAKAYARWTGNACKADGLRFELREVPNSKPKQGKPGLPSI